MIIIWVEEEDEISVDEGFNQPGKKSSSKRNNNRSNCLPTTLNPQSRAPEKTRKKNSNSKKSSSNCISKPRVKETTMNRHNANQAYYVLGHKTANIRDLYTLGQKLGQGQFGTTYLCTENSTGIKYACKSIAKRKLISKEDVEDVRREIQIMHHLTGHKNIVTIKGAYEDPLYVHIVMELCNGGELFDRIIQRGQYSERKAAELTKIIVIAESLSEEEIAGLREMFKAMDTDNSGAITFDELKAGLKRFGSTLKDTEIRDLMDAVQLVLTAWCHADVDNSGTIDYGEFVAATMHLNKLDREEHLVSAFRYFDKDGSGYITVDELQQACIDHNMTDILVEDIIKEVDQDNDGRIDYGEFVAMMTKGNAGIGRRTMSKSLNNSKRGDN
ncbi:hypothetical protein M8C21_027823 [Ambrosia artemisiifolia]|uniref:non-specific serine/threonine protein kinase n=1 Tax=Ambrosia artemisiifolia TaxID=4212 RepID=A0AAD5CK50_AMBAR|nr:hypothetical protein M8C21_027823 [Ambrosia artemisiifolia]